MEDLGSDAVKGPKTSPVKRGKHQDQRTGRRRKKARRFTMMEDDWGEREDDLNHSVRLEESVQHPNHHQLRVGSTQLKISAFFTPSIRPLHPLPWRVFQPPDRGIRLLASANWMPSLR